jgi:predicted NBD/HSP70 family sugar kinase
MKPQNGQVIIGVIVLVAVFIGGCAVGHRDAMNDVGEASRYASYKVMYMRQEIEARAGKPLADEIDFKAGAMAERMTREAR